MPDSRSPLQESDARLTVWVCPVHGQRDYPSGSVGQCGAAIRVDGQPFELRLYCQHTLAKVDVVPRSVAEALAEALAEIAAGAAQVGRKINNVAETALAEYRALTPKETKP